MMNSKQARMQILMDKNSLGRITPDEYAELAQLVEQGQRLTLRKAEAMKRLLERGYTVTLDKILPLPRPSFRGRFFVFDTVSSSQSLCFSPLALRERGWG
jgi:hypothetical protein